MAVVDKSTKRALLARLSVWVNHRFAQSLADFFARLYHAEGVEGVILQLNNDWGEFGDFLTTKTNDGAYKSRIARNYDRDSLRRDNETYHHNLTLSHRTYDKGPDGLVILDLGSVGEVWAGWTWVSLGCGYSPAEGAAAGHCGNSGRSTGDNILSLRDPQNRVHLTFVVNNGKLGESKAPDNKKPLPIYHPVVIALLGSGYINGIDEEGSYLPEKNFKMTDLPEAVCTEMLTQMAAIEVPLKPENLREPSYLLQFTQEMVDGMDLLAKKNLMNVAMNIINDMGYDADEYDAMGKFRQSILFNFQPLVREVIPSMSLRELMEVLEKGNEVESRESNYEWRSKEKHKVEPIGSRLVDDKLLYDIACLARAASVTLESKIRLLDKTRYVGSEKDVALRTLDKELNAVIMAEMGETPTINNSLVRYINYLQDFDSMVEAEAYKRQYAHRLSRVVIEDFVTKDRTEEEWKKWEGIIQSYLWDVAKEKEFSFGYKYLSDYEDARDYQLGWRVREGIDKQITAQWTKLADELLWKSTHVINKKVLRSRRQRFIESVLDYLALDINKDIAAKLKKALSKGQKPYTKEDNEKDGHGWSWDVVQDIDRMDFLKWVYHDADGLAQYYKDTQARLLHVAQKAIAEAGKRLPAVYARYLHRLRADVDKKRVKHWPLEW